MKYMHFHAYCNNIRDNQWNSLSAHQWMNAKKWCDKYAHKHTHEHTHSECNVIYHEKEGNPDVFDNLNKHRGHYAKICDFILIFFLVLYLNVHLIYIFWKAYIIFYPRRKLWSYCIYYFPTKPHSWLSVIKHSLMKSL